MIVKVLFNGTKNDIINNMWVSARTCYSKDNPITLQNQCELDSSEETMEKRLKLVKHVLDSGHTSIAENITFKLLVSGVSKALATQLMRHRAGIVFAQQSQRYCNLSESFEYVIPKTIGNNKEALDLFKQTMETLHNVYNTFIGMGIKPEDARAVLPNACCTNFTATVNLRELMHICNERLCSTAQAEIRQLFNIIAFAVKKELPFLSDYLVPKCEMLGYCNESEKRSCGRKPLKKDIIINKKLYNIINNGD